MCRIVVDIVVAIFVGIEMEYEGVRHAILRVFSRSAQGSYNSNSTCRASIELSFPPDIDRIYGARVLGWMHVFFRANIFEVIYRTSACSLGASFAS